jgi:hypothetical protein
MDGSTAFLSKKRNIPRLYGKTEHVSTEESRNIHTFPNAPKKPQRSYAIRFINNFYHHLLNDHSFRDGSQAQDLGF